MPIRDKVYDKLKSIGLTDSKEDFFKYFDNNESVRKQAYNKLRDAGLTDSEEDFYDYMKPEQTKVQQVDEQVKAEPYTHEYGADGSLIGGTALKEVGKPREVAPEVTERILANKPDYFKSPGQSLIDIPLGREPQKVELDVVKPMDSQFGRNYTANKVIDTINDVYSGVGYDYKAQKRIENAIEDSKNPEVVKSRTASQMRGLANDVDALLEEAHGKLKKKAPVGGNAMNALMSSRQYGQDNASVRQEISKLDAAKRLLEQSQNVVDEAGKKGKTNFVAGTLRGFWDNLEGEDFTFGAADASSSASILNALEKVEEGKPLTDAEDALLKASAINMAVQYHYANDLGEGYKAGGVTAESVPFMLEMLINPIAGFGKASAKTLLNYGLKAFAKNAVKGLAKGAVAGVGMASTTGLGNVVSGMNERLAGNYDYMVDNEGKLHVDKKDEVMGSGEALARSFASRAIENQSEMIFRAFDGAGQLLKGVQKYIPGGVNKFFSDIAESKVGQLYKGIKNSPLRKELAEATQVGGIGEEYLEEVYNNLANFAIGEMEWEDVVSLDKNIETLLGLAPTQAMFAMLGLGGMGMQRYNNRKSINNAFGKMSEEQKAKLKELQEMGKLNENKDIAEFIKITIADKSLTPEEKRAEIEYAYNLAKQNAISEVAEVETQDRVEADNASIDAATDTQTGNYAQVTAILSDGLGGTKEVVGNVVCWIGDSPIFVADGMENTEENRRVLKQGEWNPETLIARPAEEVKAINEDIIREEVAAQAERESKYAPEVLSKQMEQGIPFETADAIYLPIQPMAEGNGWTVEVQPKATNNKTASKSEVIELTNDEFYDLLQADLEAQESVQAEIAQSESVGEQVNAPVNTEVNNPMENAESTPMSEEVQSTTEEKSTQPVIPTKKDGSIDFVAYGREGTLKTLGEKYGEKLPNKVAVTAKALAEDVVKAEEKLAKAEEAYDNAPIGREQKAEQARDKARQELEEVKKEADYWKAIDEEIKEAQKAREAIVNPTVEADMSNEPMTTEEFVAKALADGGIRLTSDSYKKELGYGEKERKRFPKMFAKKENGGLSIEEAGEWLMQWDSENGTNFFDQEDANAGRDALINFLGSVRTWGDVTGYIRRNREQLAERESEGLRNEVESAIEANYHMTPEEYATLQEVESVENPFGGLDVATKDAIFVEAYEEYEQSLNPKQNDEGRTSEIAEGNGSVLFEERTDNEGRADERQGERPDVSKGAVQQNDAAQEAEQVEEPLTIQEGESPVAFAERVVEEQRRKPLRNRANEWAKALGVKVHFIERLEDVENQAAYLALSNGSKVAGWYEGATGEVFLYMPNLDNIAEVDKTYIHEVVAHKGLREMLGKERFNELCDKVWDMMPDKEKAEFIQYEGVNGDTRAAADEYIAYLAEKENLTPEEQTIWDSIVKMFRDMLDRALNGIIGKSKLTDKDISDLIKASYANLKSDAEGGVGEGTRFSVKEVGMNDNGVPEWYANIRLSGTLDQNNMPFVSSPSGGIDFGNIDEKHHLPSAPIRLSMGNAENGYIHINRRHGKQIKNAGYGSIEEFVKYVVDNFTRIQEGDSYENKAGGINNTYLVQLQDEHNNTLFVQLSRDGEYWNVNSAGVFNKKYGDKKKNIWSASEVQNDNSAVISDGSQSEPNADSGSTSNGTPSISLDKDNNSESEKQEKKPSFRVKKDKNDLVAIHNISEDNLRKVLSVGGLIMPSIAITKANMGHEGYGEISLLFDKETINPTDRRNKVYGGDAWTPRFPQMVPKLNEKVSSRVYKKIKELITDRVLSENYSLSAELHSDNIERTISDRGIAGYYGKEWMKLAYLFDNGKKIKIPMKMKDYGDMSETILEMAKERGLKASDIQKGGFEFYQNNADFVAAVKNVVDEMKLSSLPEEQRDTVRKLFGEKEMKFAYFDTLISAATRMEYDLEHGGLKKILDRAALRESIEKKVKTDNTDYNKWVDNLFDGIVEKYGIRNGRDWYTPSGNLRPWGQLYDEATPSNILKHMLAANEQGGSGGFFDSNIMGASAETYESIEEIREKGKKRLRRLEEGEYEEWSNSISERMSQICYDFLSEKQRNEFGSSIDAKIAITNAVAKDKSAKGIYKEMKREYPDFSMEHAKQIEEIVKEIQDFAIGYFEAKPRRIVSLNEIRKAIVPKNTSEDILEGLKDNGIEVATYKSGDEAARARLIKKESEGIRFRVSNRNQEIFAHEPAIDYASQANDVVEVPKDEVMYTINNIASQLYKTSGRFMRQLYQNGTLGRVLKGDYAEIDQIKAKNEYDHAKPILDEYLNELVWMKYQATDAAQEVINGVISDVEYAIKYYKDLSLGKDVWRTEERPRFRIVEKQREDVNKGVDSFTSKYNSKPVSVASSDMTDEELEKAVPTSLAEDTRKDIEEGLKGRYSVKADKIYIFADNVNKEELEDTLFHENLHHILSGKLMVEEFYNNFNEKHPEQVKGLAEGYKESDLPEEVFVITTAHAMMSGRFDIVNRFLSEESKNELLNILKDFGYDYEQERTRRIDGRTDGQVEEGRTDVAEGKEKGERRGRSSDEASQRDGVQGRGLEESGSAEGTERSNARTKEQAEKLRDLFGRVADMGLDGVLGNEAYDRAMMDIYSVLPEDSRKEVIDDAFNHYGMNIAPAVSDYIHGKSDGNILDKIVAIIRNALRKVGFNIDLNGNEVKYLAWRSKKPLDRSNLVDIAEDIYKRYQLKVGEYSTNDDGTTPDGGGTRFRVSNKLQVRDEYEATIKKGGYQAREAVQDAMLSLRRFQELIEKESGKKLKDFENAWMHENRLSSVVQAAIHEMERKFYKPMTESVKKLMKAADIKQEEVADYLMLKHGIERNREMAVRKALTDAEGKIDRAHLEQWYQDKEAIRNDANLDTWRKKQEAMDNLALNYGADMSRDYSGLTSMFDTDDIEECTNRAYDEVEALENAYPAETEALGKAVKAMTQNTLDESFRSGLMDRKVYDELSKDMYDYYIPLRGFEETTSEEVYAYLDQDRGAFNAPLKRAKGRSSKSDNPIAYLKSIAESGIMQGERNKMKQSFLNMVINHPSDLVSIHEGVWVVFNPATGEWEAAAPPAIPNNATPADVESAMEAWVQQMEQAAQNDPTLVKKVTEAADVPYRVVGNRMNQHQIIVKRLGKSYTLTVNGNPRLAMALNGLTNPNNTSNDGKVSAYVSGKFGALNRFLASVYTTKNPDFVVSNFMRDTFYTNTIVRAKEGNSYANKFHKHYAELLMPGKMISLFKKYEKGTLDMSNATEAAFKDFMMNGGETGYSNLKDLENIKKQIAKDLKGNRLEVVEKVAEKLDILNRAVENTARFAAYLTSREEGRSIAKSVFDAKEISVNFNKKGAGGTFFGMTGQTKLGNLAAMVGAGGRALYVFFNAAIQGTTNLLHVMKKSPKGISAGIAAMFLMGAVLPFLLDDDEEKDYYDLPEHVRRNHLILPGFGDAWISIPLPIEYRIMYGMGELLTSWRTGHERGSDIGRKMLSLTGQALPLNFLEEGFDAFIPSSLSPLWQVYNNKSWTGLPLYKDNEFNKDDPEYTKAYKNADKTLYNVSKALYDWTFDEENQEAGINLNPAVLEALARGYFGGFATQLGNLGKTWETIAGEREFDWRSIPIGNRVFKSGDERTKEKRITNEYFENMEKLDFMQSRERTLKKTINGVSVPQEDKDRAKEDYDKMKDTDIYKKYQEFKKKKKDVDKLRKRMKEKGSTEELEKKLTTAQEEANKVVR